MMLKKIWDRITFSNLLSSLIYSVQSKPIKMTKTKILTICQILEGQYLVIAIQMLTNWHQKHKDSKR